MRAHRRARSRSSTPTPSRCVYGRRDEGWEPRHADAPVLARLRSRLPAARQLHPDPHAPAAARALPEGRRLRRGARVLGGLGLPDPPLRSRRLPPRARGHLRVPGLRGRAAAIRATRGRRGGLPGGAAQRSTSATRARRTDAGLARVIDRLRAQVAFWYDRDRRSQGELATSASGTGPRREAAGRAGAARAARAAPAPTSSRPSGPRRTRERAASTRGSRSLAATRGTTPAREDARRDRAALNGSSQQIYASRTWKLHLFLDRLRGPRAAAVTRRVVVLAPEPIRPRMAGMGIRALELARALCRRVRRARCSSPTTPPRRRAVAGRRPAGRRRRGGLAGPRRGRGRGGRLGPRRQRLVPPGPGRPGRRGPLRSVLRREPPLRRDARRGDGAARPRDARARARPRGLLSLRLAPSSGSSTPARSTPRAGSARDNFPGDPDARGAARRRALRRARASPPPGDRAAGPPRRRRCRPTGPLVLFGGIYDWYDPELLLEAWPGDRAPPSRTRGCSSSRTRTPRRRRSASTPGRRGRARGSSIRTGGRSSSRRGCRTRRAPTSTRRRTCSSRSRPPGLETDLAFRTRLLDAAWGGVPSVSVGRGPLARGARGGGRRRSSSSAARPRSPTASSASSRIATAPATAAGRPGGSRPRARLEPGRRAARRLVPRGARGSGRLPLPPARGADCRAGSVCAAGDACVAK